jgi:chemotaxis signal transduction protein
MLFRLMTLETERAEFIARPQGTEIDRVRGRKQVATAREKSERYAEEYLCLFFRVGRESCGIPLHEVQKVTEFSSLNRFPRLPQPVLGISHHHGRVLTVISLPQILAGAATDGQENSQAIDPRIKGSQRLVILAREPRNIAILVDQLFGTGQFRPLDQAGVRHLGLSVGETEGRIAQTLDVDWFLESVQKLTETVTMDNV